MKPFCFFIGYPKEFVISFLIPFRQSLRPSTLRFQRPKDSRIVIYELSGKTLPKVGCCTSPGPMILWTRKIPSKSLASFLRSVCPPIFFAQCCILHLTTLIDSKDLHHLLLNGIKRSWTFSGRGNVQELTPSSQICSRPEATDPPRYYRNFRARCHICLKTDVMSTLPHFRLLGKEIVNFQDTEAE